MTALVVLPLEADVRIDASLDAPDVAPMIAERVDQIWEEELARRGSSLHDGHVFSVDTVTPRAITARRTSYRRFVAQRRDPSLYAMLRVRPLAVTGVLACADGYVVGRRAGFVEQDPGCWELVPAGGVDGSVRRDDGSPDAVGQVLAELTEETGISAEDVLAAEPFVLVNDPISHVSDIGIRLSTRLRSADVHAVFDALPNREYDELRVLPAAELLVFAGEAGDRFAPVSRRLLRVAGLLPAASA